MITQRQQTIFSFIKGHFREHGLAPTLQEIADAVGIQTRSAIHRHIRALEKAGYLENNPYRHRGLAIASAFSDPIPIAPTRPHVPLSLVGSIAAGYPIEAIEEPEHLDLSGMFGGDEHFALTVKGNSMIEEGILDGDVVICQKANTARDGMIVVALIDQCEATLKRFKLENGTGHVLLIPANSQLAGMRYSADRVQIQGIFMGLLRLPH